MRGKSKIFFIHSHLHLAIIIALAIALGFTMATLKIIIRKNSRLKDGTYPVAIRLAANGKQSTHIRLRGFSVRHPNEWVDTLGRFGRKKTNYKKFNTLLNDAEKKADSILELLEAQHRFSYESFRQMYSGNVVEDNVVAAFEKRIKDLKDVGRFGSADYYNSCLVSILKFTKGKQIVFSDIDYSFLRRYEKFRLANGNTTNTIAIHMRAIRAIHYEHAKECGKVKPNCYLDFNIQRLIKPTRKRSLSREELKRLMSYQPISQNEQRSIDLFMFSFYCNGISFIDVAKLKKANIVNERIEYTRSKTGGLFSVLISQPMKEIISRYEGGKYLFPIINGKNHRTEIKTFNNNLNRTLKRIAKKIGLPALSIYWSRHTVAALSRDAGFNIDIISKMLGHSSVEVTKTYLSGFSNDIIDSVGVTILDRL